MEGPHGAREGGTARADEKSGAGGVAMARRGGLRASMTVCEREVRRARPCLSRGGGQRAGESRSHAPGRASRACCVWEGYHDLAVQFDY